MAMRGRKPVPNEIRDLTGNKSSHPPANPKGHKIKRPLGGPPSWMTKMQKEIWREGLANCPAGLLRALDSSIYQAWVFACYSQRRAAERFATEGEHMTIMTVNGGVRENPLLRIMRSEGSQMAKLASEMGFTPSARMRVKGDGDDKPEDENEFNEFTQAPGSGTKPN